MKQLRIKKEQGMILCVWLIFLLVIPIILMDWTRISDASEIWRGFSDIWLRILPFLLLYILHHDGLMRWYPQKKEWYLTGLAVAILLFGAWQFLNPHRPGPPNDRPGPPPHEVRAKPSHEVGPADTLPDTLASMPSGQPFGPPPDRADGPAFDQQDGSRPFDRPGPPPDGDRPGPPPDGNGPDGPHHPHGPEVSFILLGLLIISGDFAGTLYVRKKREEEENKRAAEKGQANGIADNASPDNTAQSPSELYFMSDYHRVKVLVEDILYVQSMGEYIKIYRSNEAMPLITLYGIAKLASELPKGQFVRIHRSYIVARNAIEKTSRSEVVLTGGTTLPVGATYKDALASKA